MYIAFDGGEGGGKTTQIRLLVNYLTGRGKKVLAIREPGQTPIGLEIRDIVLNPKYAGIMHPVAELLLFMAARAQGVNQVVKPALEEGLTIVSDRSPYTSLPYQGGRGIALEVIWFLINISVGNVLPDIVFLLDLPVEVGLSRKRFQDEVMRFELENIAYHERVRQGFLDLAKADPDRWVVLDATLSVEQIHQQVIAELASRFAI